MNTVIERMGTWWTAALAAFLIIGAAACLFHLAGSGSIAFASQSPTPKLGCAARPGNTLRRSHSLRAFSAVDEEGVRRIYVCAKSTGKVWPVAASTATAAPPIRLSGIWAAASTESARGQDLLIRGVAARDALSGRLNHCRIGAANRPGQLIRVSSLVVTDSGDIGWSGHEVIGLGLSVVGACIDDSDRIVARGSGVEVHSLSLSGNSLVWSNAGAKESFSFG